MAKPDCAPALDASQAQPYRTPSLGDLPTAAVDKAISTAVSTRRGVLFPLTGGIDWTGISCPAVALFIDVHDRVAAALLLAITAAPIAQIAVSIIALFPWVHGIIATYKPLNAFALTIDNPALEIGWTGEPVMA